MEIKWQRLITKIFFWLLIEAIFNLIEIDDLADYSEFLLIPKNPLISQELVQV